MLRHCLFELRDPIAGDAKFEVAKLVQIDARSYQPPAGDHLISQQCVEEFVRKIDRRRARNILHSECQKMG